MPIVFSHVRTLGGLVIRLASLKRPLLALSIKWQGAEQWAILNASSAENEYFCRCASSSPWGKR